MVSKSYVKSLEDVECLFEGGFCDRNVVGLSKFCQLSNKVTDTNKRQISIFKFIDEGSSPENYHVGNISF